MHSVLQPLEPGPVMSQYKSAIVQTFSMFCVVHETRSQQVIWSRDRALQQLLLSLVDDSFRATPEAWARYFLLAAQQEQLRGATLSEYQLQPLIDQLMTHSSKMAQQIRVIYTQMIARQTDPDIINFLRTPAPRAQKCLTAYLQPACLYSARHFYYTKIQSSSLRHRYALEDCFQIVSEQASQPLKLLRNFQVSQDQVKLKTYAEKAFRGILQNTVEYSMLKFESTWKLLRYLSKRELVKALQLKSFSEQEICHYALLWYCFKELYQTKQVRQNRLVPPTENQIQQIRDRYHQRYEEFNLVEPIQTALVVPHLEAIAQAVREYRHPNAVLSRMQQNSMLETPDPLLELIQIEQLAQVKAIAQAAFSDLPEVAQKTLRFWFGLNLNHAEILKLLGAELGLQKQYQLSRRIKQYRMMLLKSVIEKLNAELLEKLHNSKDTEKTMDDLLETIDAYLSDNCKNYFYEPLEIAVQKFRLNEKLLLHAYYQQHLELDQLKQQFSIASDAILPLLEILVQFLRSSLQQWIQSNLDLNLRPYNSINSKLNHLIETWLQTDAAFNFS